MAGAVVIVATTTAVKVPWARIQQLVTAFPTVLAEKCHPLTDQRVSPNNPKGLFVLSDGSLNGCMFSASTG